MIQTHQILSSYKKVAISALKKLYKYSNMKAQTNRTVTYFDFNNAVRLSEFRWCTMASLRVGSMDSTANRIKYVQSKTVIKSFNVYVCLMRTKPYSV